MIWFVIAYVAGGVSAYIANQRSERELIKRYEARISELERQLNGCNRHIEELTDQNKALREEIS